MRTLISKSPNEFNTEYILLVETSKVTTKKYEAIVLSRANTMISDLRKTYGSNNVEVSNSYFDIFGTEVIDIEVKRNEFEAVGSFKNIEAAKKAEKKYK